MLSGGVIERGPVSAADVARERIVNLYVAGATPTRIARRMKMTRAAIELITGSTEVQALRQAARDACSASAWTEAENDTLETMWIEGDSDAAIADRLKRTVGAVQYQRVRVLDLHRHPDGRPVLSTDPALDLRYDPFARFVNSEAGAGFMIEAPDEVEAAKAKAAAIIACMPAPLPPQRARPIGLAHGTLPEISITDAIYARLLSAGPIDCIDCGADAILTAGEFRGRRAHRHLKCTGCGRSWRQEIA